MYENPDGVMIGLEVHVQLNKLKTKIFCGCSTDYHNDPPNSHVCPVCLGLPGSMPVINKKAVEAAIKVGLAFNCEVEEHTQFYRKNYFYPDLPKAFQITQYDFPISSNGYVIIEGEDGEHKVRINRAHMEEDPGRLVHEGTIDKSKYTLIDYNRSGMALLEIVSEPDMRSPKEARRYLDKIRNIIEYLGVSDVDLEGAMRVDANISIMGGQRAEIKNISSFKGAERALLFEIVRQKNVLRRGGTVVLETRHFDEAQEITLSMRSKEEAHDYRYFPEPDLVPLKISGWAPAIKETLPELPDARRMRFVEQYGITDDHAKSLTSELKLAVFYEPVAQEVDPKLAAVWVNDVLKGELNYRDLTIDAFSKEDILSIIRLVSGDKITEKGAVEVIRTVLDNGGAPEDIVKEKGLLKVEGDIVETAAEEAIAENPQSVDDYRAGKEKALNALVGAVMKKTRGRADARTAREILLEKLFDELSSEFVEKRNKKNLTKEEKQKLTNDRISIVLKCSYIGSNIENIKFLLDKLDKGNFGEKVCAAATFEILLKKEAFNLLLSNISYTGDGGSYVRYRVIGVLNAYHKANKLNPEEIIILIDILTKQGVSENYSNIKGKIYEFLDRLKL